MSVDPSIALGVKPIQLDNPINMMGQVMGLRNAQQEYQVNQLKIQQMRDAQAEDAALNRVWNMSLNPTTGKPDTQKLYTLMASNGLGKRIPELQAKFAEADYKSSETASKTTETAVKHASMYRDLLPLVKTRDDAVQWLSLQHSDPRLAGTPVANTSIEALTANIPTDPAEFQTWKEQTSLGMGKWLEDNAIKTVPAGGVTYGVGGLHGDAKVEYKHTEDPNSIARAAEKIPLGFRMSPVGNLEFIPGGPADPNYKGKVTSTQLDVKDIAKREAAYPKATLAIKSSSDDIDTFIAQAKELQSHPGLSQITGTVYGRTPNISNAANAAQALFDTVLAKGQFKSLQALRAASPTGGALGNVSDKEEAALRASVGALSRAQSTEDFRRQLGHVIADAEVAKQHLQDAYDTTYEYRNGGEKPAPKGAPVTIKGDADYAKLPSGTEFIGPDGVHRTKP